MNLCQKGYSYIPDLTYSKLRFNLWRMYMNWPKILMNLFLYRIYALLITIFLVCMMAELGYLYWEYLNYV